YRIEEQDLYPDVVSVLRQLKTAGYRIGITGNQPLGAVQQVAALGLPVDFMGSSSEWGVAKPDPGFFERIAAGLDLAYDQILYVGDRLDNDVLPAQDIGMHAAFLRRGPWGYLQASWPNAAGVEHRIDGLTGVIRVLDRIEARIAATEVRS
nr:HAD family hydrolase [Chloroflexia bacterium]